MTKEHFLLSLEKELKQQQIENFTTYINYYDEIIMIIWRMDIRS